MSNNNTTPSRREELIAAVAKVGVHEAVRRIESIAIEQRIAAKQTTDPVAFKETTETPEAVAAWEAYRWSPPTREDVEGSALRNAWFDGRAFGLVEGAMAVARPDGQAYAQGVERGCTEERERWRRWLNSIPPQFGVQSDGSWDWTRINRLYPPPDREEVENGG